MAIAQGFGSPQRICSSLQLWEPKMLDHLKRTKIHTEIQAEVYRRLLAAHLLLQLLSHNQEALASKKTQEGR